MQKDLAAGGFLFGVAQLLPGKVPVGVEPAGIAGGDDPDRPGIVHRLDVGTTGLMVAARSQTAYESIVDQLSRRDVHREYLAVAVGRCAPREEEHEGAESADAQQRT
ncbi:MAG: hypothetical protein EBY81_05045, partial [Verrucomicrobia bacterium]|nr:hypothetical protein [Verrucomicrobiota bacterium]